MFSLMRCVYLRVRTCAHVCTLQVNFISLKKKKPRAVNLSSCLGKEDEEENEEKMSLELKPLSPSTWWKSQWQEAT